MASPWLSFWGFWWRFFGGGAREADLGRLFLLFWLYANVAITHGGIMTRKKTPEEKALSNPIGRPTKYNPKYCDEVGELLSEGHSLYAVAAHFDVSLDTIYEWKRNFPEFSEALKKGQVKSALWWENRAKEFSLTGVGNATAIIFGLKNRAKDLWQDKTETEHSGEVTVKKLTFREAARQNANGGN